MKLNTLSDIVVVTYVLLLVWGCIFLSSYLIEKTLRSDGTESVILVDPNYQIIEPVVLFLEYLEKKGNAVNTIESYCRGLKEYYTWLKKEE